MKLLRTPLLHFCVIGALLYAGLQVFSSPDPIRFSAAEVQQLARDWQRDSGRAPSNAELATSLRTRADEEILLREALRLSLDERDPVARRRLLQNMSFAFPESQEDDAHLLRAAQRLGMSTRDTVVRGRLVELMRARAQGGVTLTRAQVDDYVQEHAQRYATPARYDFRQVYFSSDYHHEADAAARALARLRAGEPVAGDPFLLGDQYSGLSLDDITQRFGEGFAQQLAQAPVGAWSGPITSAYGQHLVRIEQYQPGQAPQPAAVRTRAAYAALAGREQAALDQVLAQLRTRYRVELPDGMAALR